MTASATSHLPGRDHLLARAASALRHEYILFLIATSAVGLHIVDDNFLQPQAGTSAGDHLASGLIPIAVLAAVAALYPRLRAGPRATTAIPSARSSILGGSSLEPSRVGSPEPKTCPHDLSPRQHPRRRRASRPAPTRTPYQESARGRAFP